MSMTGFIILVVLILLLVWIYVELAKIPGTTARQRGHPQADAINVLGWVGLLFGAVPWVVALVWAYTRSSTQPVTQSVSDPGRSEPNEISGSKE